MAAREKSSFPFAQFAFALALGSVGGVVFFLLRLPLPFMLGSMMFCMVAAMARLPVLAPIQVRPPMSAVIGAMIGSAVTPALLDEIPALIASLLWLVAFIAIAGAVCVTYLHRVIGFDFRTAYFAGMPGGLIEMVMLADEHGGDSRKVAIVQTLRVVLVVFTVPFLVLTLTGAERVTGFDTTNSFEVVDSGFLFWFSFSAVAGIGLGMLLRLPARYFVGPMLVSGVVHMAGWSDYKLPFEMVIVAQIVLGATIGCRFVGVPVRQLSEVAVASVGSTFLLLLLTGAFALLVSETTNLSFLAVFLSYSPGGVAEISLLALALQVETAIVTIHHIARIVLVGFGGPLLFVLGRNLRNRRRK